MKDKPLTLQTAHLGRLRCTQQGEGPGRQLMETPAATPARGCSHCGSDLRPPARCGLMARAPRSPEATGSGKAGPSQPSLRLASCQHPLPRADGHCKASSPPSAPDTHTHMHMVQAPKGRQRVFPPSQWGQPSPLTRPRQNLRSAQPPLPGISQPRDHPGPSPRVART